MSAQLTTGSPTGSPSDPCGSPTAPNDRPTTFRSGTCAPKRSVGAAPSALAERNRRVEQYRAVVRPLALHYCRCSRESLDDLLQVGLMGLIRAAELYSPDRQTPFEAFARPHIRGAILHYLRDASPLVRLPRRQAELQERFNRLRHHPSLHLHPEQAVAVLSGSLGITPEEWRRLEVQRLLSHPAPLDDPELVEAVADTAAPERPAEEEPGVRALEMLERLEPRQQLVVRQVVLAGWSYRELGRRMKVSPMTVKRLLHKGLEELRRRMDAAAVSPGGRPAGAASAAPGW